MFCSFSLFSLSLIKEYIACFATICCYSPPSLYMFSKSGWNIFIIILIKINETES